MRTSAIVAMVAMVLSLGLIGGAFAAQGQTDSGAVSGGPSPSTTMKSDTPAQSAPGPIISPGTAGRTETIEGEVLRIERDYYIVRDTAGREVRLHIDKSSNIDGNISPNDKIVARAIDMSGGSAPGQPATGPESGRTPNATTWHADSIKKK